MISALPQILARLVEQPSGGLRLDCECLGVFGHGQGMREQPRVDGPYVRVCVVGGKCGCDQAQRLRLVRDICQRRTSTALQAG
jgi:hypothetical protein